jgi:RES domain-containing protein
VIAAWRLVKERHAKTAFDGEGARQFGGRWNPPGVRVVYVSDSLALAALETFVHLGRAASHIAHAAIRVVIPDDVAVRTVAVGDLPAGWRTEPPPDSTKDIGSTWVGSGETAVLRVPSVLVPAESNLVLNPAHPEFARLEISPPQPFSFDPRMWK